jgi:hypothetical protein
MKQLYWNLIILFILLVCVIWIHYFGSKHETFFNINDFAPIPFIYNTKLNYFDDIPSGYDSATRSYLNPYFAQQVAQGLDTN